MYQLPELVAKANHILGDAHGSISRRVVLSERFGVLDLEQCSVYDQVLASRFLRKFEEPSARNITSLKKKCYADWVTDEEHLSKYCFDTIPLRYKSVLYRARQLLHSWCEGFKPAPIIDFTPGESFAPARGYTSVMRKLANPEHWTVTYEAFDDFAAMVYNNTGLKRAARRLMKPLTAAEAKILLSVSDGPFDAFKKRLEQVCTLVRGSRLSSVPKNNVKRRAINVEATGNILLQRTVAHGLLPILKDVGNDLEVGQWVHRQRIADPSVATVDFSSASDLIRLDVIVALFPQLVTKYIKKWRSQMVLVDGVYYLPLKFASMGCGFTFEVMTMLLLSIARVLDPKATVYGDDVIISNDQADLFIEVCESFGMRVNRDKSFIRTPFRESCGAYHCDGLGYVVSYDFHWCETWFDVTVSANKLKRIIDAHPLKEGVLYDILSEAHNKLLALTPTLLQGYVTDDISCGFVHNDKIQDLDKASRADVECKKLHNHVAPLVKRAFSEWQLPLQYKVVKLLVYKPKTGWYIKKGQFRDQGPKYLASLLNGTCATDVIRNAGQWVEKLAIVSPDGGLWRFSSLKEIKWGE